MRFPPAALGGWEGSRAMFLFFNNRWGCLTSLAVSAGGTLLVLFLMGLLN